MVRLGRDGWTGTYPIHEGARHVSPPPSSRCCRGHRGDGDRRPGRRVGVWRRFAIRQTSAFVRGEQVRGSVRAARRGRFGGDQYEPAAGRAGRGEAGGRQQRRGRRSVRRLDGVSTATAQRIVDAVFGTPVDRSLTGPAAVSTLATRLGVSTGAAERALQQIGALSRQGGVDSTGPAFAAIAHDLGVSPARLAAAMDGLKQSIAGK